MTRRLSVLSVLFGFGAWLLLAAALVAGGLDSSGSINPRVFVYPSGLFSLLGLVLGGTGLVRGPHRILAGAGFFISAFFILSFVGIVPL